MAWVQNCTPDPANLSKLVQSPPLKVEGHLINTVNTSSENPKFNLSCFSANGKNEPEKNVVNGDPVTSGVMLSDYLKDDLDIVVIGINPSLGSGNIFHHYAGTGNHFWTCLYESNLVPIPMDFNDDATVLNYGIGFTNICAKSSKGISDLSRKDVKEGSAAMLEKIRLYKPKIVVFNGKGIYETFVGHKNFNMGKQPEPLEGTNTVVFVMPSSSARCAQLPRAEDKLPFFVALRKLREHLRGERPHLEESEVVFADYTEFRVTTPDPKSLRKAERRRKRKSEAAAAAAASAATAVLEQSNRQLDGCIIDSASLRKKKKQTTTIAVHPPCLTSSDALISNVMKNVSIPNSLLSADGFHFQPHQPTPHFQGQSLLQATHTHTALHQPQQIFAMQPTAQFHPHHQMFVPAGGQLMTAGPMVSLAMPSAGQQASPAAGTGCYGSATFHQFIMNQPATGQTTGMVAWQPTAAAWPAYPGQSAAVGTPQQHHHHHHHTPQQFLFTGGQPSAPVYPQQVYFTAVPSATAGTPASYQLLPVGCHPQNGFTGVFLADQNSANSTVATAATATQYAPMGSALIPTIDSVQAVAAAAAAAAATSPQTSLITLGSPHFKVMAVGATGSPMMPTAMPQFVSHAAALQAHTALTGSGKVTAVTQTSSNTPALQAPSVPLVQTAAGGDEGGQAGANSTVSDEKVIYSAL